MGTEHLPLILRESVTRVSNNTKAGSNGGCVTRYRLNDGNKSMDFEGACFSGLSGHVVNNEFDPQKTTLTYLPFDLKGIMKTSDVLQWYKLCQTVGIMPKDQNPEALFKQGLVIFLGDDNLSPFDFYTQVCFYRYPHEFPRLIENILDLVYNGGADFWAAFTFCHDLNVTNCGHSIVGSGVYSTTKALGRGSVGLAVSMHRMMRRKDRPDKRVMWKELKKLGSYEGLKWAAHVTVMNLSLDITEKTLKEESILDPRLIPLFHVETKEKYAELLENLKEENPDVKFKA